MCVVSMIGDYYEEKWNDPDYGKYWSTVTVAGLSDVSREEFDKLKKEVEDMKKLLAKAKKYDEDHNEPNCEIDKKMAKLKKIAELVGVDLDDVLKKS